MATKLYVGNLDYGVTTDMLTQHFGQAGQVVDSIVINDRMSGRSKGFGFVEFATEEEAQKAVEMFNGQELEGRKLVVNVARPREDRQ